MNDSLAMGGFQRVADLDANIEQLVCRDHPFMDFPWTPSERPAVEASTSGFSRLETVREKCASRGNLC
jgi:hypothetical protein